MIFVILCSTAGMQTGFPDLLPPFSLWPGGQVGAGTRSIQVIKNSLVDSSDGGLEQKQKQGRHNGDEGGKQAVFDDVLSFFVANEVTDCGNEIVHLKSPFG